MFATTTRSTTTASSVASPSLFTRFLNSLTLDLAQGERQCQEEYLAQSTDRFDLELRMRELDRANPRIYQMIGMNA